MLSRATNWATGLCYVSAACMACLAVAVFSGVLRMNSGWILVAGAAIFVASALKLHSLLSEIQDEVSENHSNRELLLAQVEEQRRAIDALADGLEVAVFICDDRASIIYANRRASEMFGHDHLVGKNVLAITLSYDLEQLVRTVSRDGGSLRQEIGFTYPQERVGLAKAWSSESSGRVFLSIYEITDLRRLERVRQDFVANVSHELRTPLTVIRAYAETLLDEDPPELESLQRYLPRVISEVDRLSTITQDLLILSAAESNPVRKQSCDLSDVFRSVLQQLTLKAEDKGLKLEFTGPQHVIIEANTAQMTQVALNLVDNAINYTTQGKVCVEMRPEGDLVIVQVKDTGIGIASEYISRIFERFYRVDKGRSRNTGGTGLGLSIVKHIVEAHGGAVAVESSLNRGSTFTVRLPVGSVSAPAQDLSASS